MNWYTTSYRLPADYKRGTCQRPISDKYPEQCPAPATCGWTSILIETGDRRYSERCDFCTNLLAERMKIKPPGLREAIIFPIPCSAKGGRCSSCHAEVRWIVTDRGNRMPVDPNGVSHFVTCAGACAHRKRA